MTIEELYDLCDNVNSETVASIISVMQSITVWRKQFSLFPSTLLHTPIKHYELIGNEVVIWVP